MLWNIHMKYTNTLYNIQYTSTLYIIHHHHHHAMPQARIMIYNIQALCILHNIQAFYISYNIQALYTIYNIQALYTLYNIQYTSTLYITQYTSTLYKVFKPILLLSISIYMGPMWLLVTLLIMMCSFWFQIWKYIHTVRTINPWSQCFGQES